MDGWRSEKGWLREKKRRAKTCGAQRCALEQAGLGLSISLSRSEGEEGEESALEKKESGERTHDMIGAPRRRWRAKALFFFLLSLCVSSSCCSCCCLHLPPTRHHAPKPPPPPTHSTHSRKKCPYRENKRKKESPLPPTQTNKQSNHTFLGNIFKIFSRIELSVFVKI